MCRPCRPRSKSAARTAVKLHAMDTNKPPLAARNFPTAEEEAAVAAEPSRYAGPESAYRLAFTDTDFLLREELRPVRMQLELLKPEMMQQEQGIESTPELVARFDGQREFEGEKHCAVHQVGSVRRVAEAEAEAAPVPVAPAPELVANLARLYEYMHNRLSDAGLNNDARAADEVIGILSDLKDAWTQAAQMCREQSAGEGQLAA